MTRTSAFQRSRFAAPVLLLAHCTSLAAGDASETQAAPALPLAPCHLEGLAEEVRCGVLEVLEDRSDAGGRTIPIHVTVLPARRREPEPDPLFLLAGGPGQGARSYARLIERFFGEVRRRRDVVLVDLRGTGDSGPLECPRPADPLAAVASGSFALDVAACLERQQADVRHYASEPAMADLDQVRAALSYQRINLWGGSYGTRAALVYARLYGDRLRSVVLDGAAPFEVKFPLSTPADGQRALDRLLADCAADPACATAFPALGDELAALLSTLEEQPARVVVRHPRTGEARQVTVTRQAFASAMRVFLYTPSHQSLVPFVVHQAAGGNLEPYLALQEQGLAWSVDTMALGQTLSVLCTEDLPRLSEEEVAAAGVGSFLGRSEIDDWRRWCTGWPRGEVAPSVLDAPPASPPALILSGELDPATPPRWGEVMARHFSHPRHVVVAGAAHNVSFSGCVPELIATFIERGSADGLDASCVASVKRPPFVLGATGTAP